MTEFLSVLTQNSQPDLTYEIALLRQGYRFIAGLDEAGRGAWAGPVVAAAVILPLDQPNLADLLAGLNDSKKLSAARRDKFFDRLQATALTFATGQATPAQVDTFNVVGATRLAMQQALTGLTPSPDFLLIDHLPLPAVDCPQFAFPKADALSLSVAAASIIAKVTRDRLMLMLHRQYPGYGFDHHKGYGTIRHRAALAKLGPCPAHRLSFGPLKAWADRV